MTVFNNNFIIAACIGDISHIPCPNEREYTHWEVSYDGIMTQIKCFISPHQGTLADSLCDYLNMLKGNIHK